MALPEVNLSFQDGGLGIVAPGAGLIAILGVSSLGTVNSLIPLSSKNDVAAQLGNGMLAAAAAYHLGASGQPILAVPVNPSVVGVNSAVVHTGTGTAVMTVAGSAFDDEDVIVKITRAAANLAAATAAFVLSQDGGDTFTPEIAVPVSGIYPIPGTGLTVTFVDGTFVVNDTYTFRSTAKTFNLTDLTNAINALTADTRIGQVEFLHIAGVSDATIAAGVAALMTSAETAFKYIWALMSVRNQNTGESEATWLAAQIAAFASFVSTRAGVAAGYEELVDPVSGKVKARPASWVYAARLANIEISQNPIEFEGGALPGIVSLQHDENKVSGLDTARFVTLRTFTGENGFFITNGNMMAALASDFSDVPRRRVADAAARIVRSQMLRLALGKRIAVDAATGFIKEEEARKLEAELDAALDAAIGSQYVDASTQIDRTNNILSTNTLNVDVGIVPFGYAKTINVTLGFTNPALQLV